MANSLDNSFSDSNDLLLDPDYNGIKLEIVLNVPKGKTGPKIRHLEDLYKKNQMAVESLSKGITPNLNISMMHNDIQKAIRKGWLQINAIYKNKNKIVIETLTGGTIKVVDIKDYTPSINVVKF